MYQKDTKSVIMDFGGQKDLPKDEVLSITDIDNFIGRYYQYLPTSSFLYLIERLPGYITQPHQPLKE
ncbi:hypothetical protein EAI32_09110 [Lactobacillus taiwanensis]|nr:hypothetical protein [Lactobacillus taiwanensis]